MTTVQEDPFDAMKSDKISLVKMANAGHENENQEFARSQMFRMTGSKICAINHQKIEWFTDTPCPLCAVTEDLTFWKGEYHKLAGTAAHLYDSVEKSVAHLKEMDSKLARLES